LEFAQVWHFLDPAVANTVIVPTELVAKAGSDFDVDKIFWNFPNLTKEGKLVTEETSIEEIERRLNSKEASDKKDLKNIIERKKKAAQNNLIKSMIGILERPEMYASLVKPNGTYIMKNLADELEEIATDYNRFEVVHGNQRTYTDKQGKVKKFASPTRALEVGMGAYKFQVNLEGKGSLGIVANQNKQSPIMKSIGAKLPKTFSTEYWDKQSQSVKETNMVFLPFTVRFKTNMLGDNISLSGNYSQDGERIADIYDHMMNGLLDIEKDAWVFFLQTNSEMVNTLNTLIEMGISKRDNIWFISQPISREYVKLQKRLKSTFRAAVTGEVVTDSQAKRQAAETLIAGRLPQTIVNDVNQVKIKHIINSISNNVTVQIKYYSDGETITSKVNGAGLKDILKSKPANDIVYIYSESGVPVYSPASLDTLLSSSNIYYLDEVLNEGVTFNYDELQKTINNSNADNQLNVLVHLLSLENQLKAWQEYKRVNTPDTKRVKTTYQMNKKEDSYSQNLESSKLDTETIEKLRNESVLSSFNISDFALDVVAPLFNLRMNPFITKYIGERLKNDRLLITQNGFPKGLEGEEMFTGAFNNAVINFIFQNSVSNFTNSDGSITSLPDVYRGKEVIIKANIPNHVEITEDKILIDYEAIKKDYREKVFEKENDAPNNYKTRGLKTFISKTDTFPTETSFVKFVVEREYLRSTTTLEQAKSNPLYKRIKQVIGERNVSENTLFEAYLAQKALLNSYNRVALMKTRNLSYSDLLMNIIETNKDALSVYPVIEQLLVIENPSLIRRGLRVIGLKNKSEATGELAETYENNLRQLADPSIKKVADKELNNYISQMFKMFPLVATYQHGVGYSMAGFPKILPVGGYLNIMKRAEDMFLTQYLNSYSLSAVARGLLEKENERFTKGYKNYVVEPAQYMGNTILELPTYTDPTDESEGPVSPQPSIEVDVKTVSEPYGVVVAETNPTVSKTQEFVNLIQPQIQAQAYKENASGTANDMFMYGLRWTRKRTATKPLNNKSYANKGLPITDAKATDGYVYDTVDQNGNPLAPVSGLQPIINEIENSLGIDMSNYDAVIGNIYLPGQNIATHRDTTESLSARNYPVIVYTIGNDSGIGIYEDKNKPGSPTFASDSKRTIPTKNGTIYTFGMDGKGRFELAHDTPKGIKRDQEFPPITLPNGDIVENYTITLTFRRAADLEPGMPTAPAKLTTTQPSTSVKPEVSELFESNPELANQVYEALGFMSTTLLEKLSYKTGKIYNAAGKEIFAGIVDGQVYINKELIDKYSNKEILDNQEPILNSILKNLNVYDRLINLPREQFINFLVAHEQAHLDFEKEGKRFNTESIEEAYVNAKALVEIGILKLKNFDLSNTNEAAERLERYLPTKEQYIDDITELVAEKMDNVNVSLSTMTGYKTDVFEGSLWGKKLQTSSMDGFYFLQGKDGYPKNKEELKEAISKDIARNIPQSIKKNYWTKILESLPDDEKALLSNWAYYNDYKRYTRQYGKPTFEFNEMPYPDLHKKGEKKYTNWTSFINGLFTSFDGRSSDLWFANPLLSDTEDSIINWYKNLTPEKLDEYISNLSRAMAFKSMVVASFEGGSNISALDSGARKVEDLQKAYYEIKQRTEIPPIQIESKNEQITPQQKQQALEAYSAYLNTVFPDSKIKDIVYHLSNAEFEKFDKKFISTNTRDFDSWLGFFFTTDKTKFKELLKSRNLEWEQEYPAILNIKKIVNEPGILSTKFKDVQGLTEKSEAYRNYKKSLLANNNDGIISPSTTGAENITVFEPEQIHILGNKQDIEGFKKFVQGTSTQPTDKLGLGGYKRGGKIISDGDITRFNTYLGKSNGVKPKEFFTPETKFAVFYNENTGKREGVPQTSKWMLKDNGYYDLIDQVSGEIYIDNVDLQTGYKFEEPLEGGFGTSKVC
jgi:hypothetical protein